MKLDPCPYCNRPPAAMSVNGLRVVTCLGCSVERGPLGQTGGTATEAKRAWNDFAREEREEAALPHTHRVRVRDRGFSEWQYLTLKGDATHDPSKAAVVSEKRARLAAENLEREFPGLRVEAVEVAAGKQEQTV